MDQFLPIALVSLLLGTAIALIFFKNYFLKRKSEIGSISKPELHSDLHKKPPKPTHQSKKPLSKPHSHVSSDKDHNKKHHPLDLNTLKGHGDSVTGLCFSYDGRSLATACADGVVRVFKLDDASSKSFKFLRINVPAGGHPVAVAFSDDASSVVVASQTLSVVMEVQLWPLVRKVLISKFGMERQERFLGNVDTNQLKNTMATISPNGRFIAAAAFTADVKVWEIVYSKDGSVKEVPKAMQLKGHKSAVTWLCFHSRLRANNHSLQRWFDKNLEHQCSLSS
ncbi:hypothetical protein OIU74_011004 [Salix koriyanagi]|uniref:Transducin/WD40 repeat-like superfamily protein n=1 Tax=Salix koriyanagi TaxID=2511006 RepID=A0A9Q0YTP9_9ROSI|nr:hypothetical protein OIU74_011004 [Salix koriyanagi]